MQPKTNRILCLVLGLIIGIGGTMLFSNNKTLTPVAATLRSPAELKNTSVLVEAQFQGKVDTLQRNNAMLAQKANSTKAELQKAKHDNKVLLELVDTLLAHAGQATDTAAKLAQCDSLSETVQELVTATVFKDSLYEDLASNLQAQVSNKDSVITVQHEQYNCLKLSFDQSLAQQQLLLGQNLLYEKQIKRDKVKSKLLTAGALILSGIVTYQFLHH